MSFEDSEKTSRVTLQKYYNFVMNQAVSITYDLWHIIFMKILLIEDNQRTQEWVTQGLSEAGYVIDAVSDGRDGLYLALKDDYALIILDIMLPELSGMEVLRRLHREKQTPVILLTARDAVMDKVSGLDAGAVDYITKKEMTELLLKFLVQQIRFLRLLVLLVIYISFVNTIQMEKQTTREFMVLEFFQRVLLLIH